MAQIDARGQNGQIDMTNASQIENSNIGSGALLVSQFVASWINASASRSISALSFPGNLAFSNGIYSGNINGIVIQAGGVDLANITDLNVNLVGLGSPFFLIGGWQTPWSEGFWNSILAGSTTIFAQDQAPTSNDTGNSNYFGDRLSISSNFISANDIFTGASYASPNYVFNSTNLAHTQDFTGDVYQTFSGVLTGGNDKMTTGTLGILVGDVRIATGGTVNGGHDEIIATGRNVTNTTSANASEFYGDTRNGEALIRGGNDTINLIDVASARNVSGDSGNITGSGTSNGGADTIFVDGRVPGTAIENLVGDVLSTTQIYTGGNDSISLSNARSSFGTNTSSNVSGDAISASNNFTGGDDIFTISGGGGFTNVAGDLIRIEDFENTLNFIGGNDSMSLLLPTASYISGDMVDNINRLEANLTGGNDIIRLTQTIPGGGFWDVVGDFRDTGDAGAVKGGNDTITVNIALGSTTVARIWGDALSLSTMRGELVGGNDIITLNSTVGGQIVGDATNVVGGFTGAAFTGGNDTLTGGSGNDQIWGDYVSLFAELVVGGNDVIDGRDGNDQLFGNEGSDRLTGGVGNDLIDGGAGIDTALFNTVDQSVFIDLGGIAGTGSGGNLDEAVGQGFDQLIGIENVVGSSLNDVIFGSANGSNIANRLDGGGGNDMLNGRDGNDTLNGGVGNDTLNGGAGVDSIDGNGGYDRAVFDFTRGAATIVHNTNGTKTITAGGFSDTLSGVELAQFSDGTLVSLQERTNKGDLSADGRSDILLRNSADGSVYVWEVNGTSLGNSGSFGSTPGAVWKARGTGDFNGDGRSDVLLQNSDTGQSSIWFSDGLGSSVSGASGPVGWAPGAQYVARATGDFNGDGRSDILLQDSTNGQCFTFLTNGTSVIGANFIGTAVGANWVANATGDFNGDGKSDILFQNSNDGTSYIWNIDGTNVIGNGQAGWTPGVDWQVRGTGDFNRDGKSDILLQNAVTGQCFTFMVDGTTAISSGQIGPAVGAGVVARGTGDFNGDGQSDILFQDTGSGTSYVWNLDGTTVTANGQVGWVPGAQWEAFV